MAVVYPSGRTGVVVARGIGMVLLLIAVGLHWRFHEMASWPQTGAEILDSRLVQVCDDGPDGTTPQCYMRPLLRYRYRVGGRVHVGDRVGPVAGLGGLGYLVEGVVRRHPAGSRTQIHYNPVDPSEAVLEPGFGSGLVYFFYLAGVVMLWIGGRSA